MFDRRLFANFNWELVIVTILCVTVGVASIFSTAVKSTGIEQTPLYLKQIQWILIGIIIMLFVISVDYRIIVESISILYN
ncbi:MAG: rod shape-determining protein RodA, partial [Deltaproteobacteria bacterium]